MNKRTKSKNIIIVLVVILLIIAYIVAVCKINITCKRADRNVYKFGETFEFQSVQMTLHNAKLITGGEMPQDESFKQAIKDLSVSENPSIPYLALIEVTLLNSNAKNTRIDLTTLHLESGAFSLQLYYELVMYYNQCGMYIDLEPGEEKMLILPIPILGLYFSETDWDTVTERTFSLVFSLYPEKQIAEIRFS